MEKCNETNPEIYLLPLKLSEVKNVSTLQVFGRPTLTTTLVDLLLTSYIQ